MKQILTIPVSSGEVTLDVVAPECLRTESLVELSTILENAGIKDADSYIFKKAYAQFLIDFRAFVRGQMDAVVSKEDPSKKYTSDQIAKAALEWVPSPREALTPAEKAKKTLSELNLTPEQLAALVAELQG